MKKRYIFIFILLSIFVMPLNSKAATVAQRSDGVTTFFDGGTTFPFAKWGNDVSIALYVYNYMVDLSYNYYIFEMCANSVPYARISNGGYNSYFSESNIVTYSTNQSCTYGGYNGSVFYIQLKVAKWGASDDGGEVMVASTLRLSYDVTWKPYSYITDYYLSTDDVLTEFVQNSKVDKDLNSILNAQNSTNSKLDSTNSKLDSANSKLDSANSKIDSTNSKLDNITDMTPDNSNSPDSSSYDSYSSAEDSLLEKAGEADLDSLEIPIDSSSSNFIWDTMSSLLNSHPLVMSTVIAVLSIGIIKLIFAR